MRKHLPLLFILLTLVIALYAPRSPAQEYQPPQLLTPENGAVIDTRTPEFFWTAGSGPARTRLFYLFTIVEVAPGTKPSSDLGLAVPFYQTRVRRNGLAYEGPPFSSKPFYAWQVRLVDANGQPLGGSTGASGISTFSYFVRESIPPVTPGNLVIDTQPLVMTGMRVGSLNIDTQPLIMTGMRAGSITISTDTLMMTGMRVGSIAINTQPLVMTGMRVGSLNIDTQPLIMTGMRIGPQTIETATLQMTGMRIESITINTDALKMTGMREEPPSSVESQKVPPQPKTQEDLNKKRNLPLKNGETIGGVNPPLEPTGGAPMKPGGAEKTVGDTAINKLHGIRPSLETPGATGESPIGTGKSTLQQKIEAKKTTDEVIK